MPGRDVANADEALRAACLVGDGTPRRDHPDASSVAMPERELAVHLATRLEVGVPCLDLVPVLGRPERVRRHRAEELVLVEPDRSQSGRLTDRMPPSWTTNSPSGIAASSVRASSHSPCSCSAAARHPARSQSANAVARPKVERRRRSHPHPAIGRRRLAKGENGENDARGGDREQEGVILRPCDARVCHAASVRTFRSNLCHARSPRGIATSP